MNKLRDRLNANAVPIQIPVGAEDNFQGVVDLVNMRARIYHDDLGQNMEDTDIPEEFAELAQEYRAKLLKLWQKPMMPLLKISEGEPFTEEEIATAIRKGTIAGTMVPILCGSAFKNRGVQLLLDAVVDYLPAPTEVPPIKGQLPDGETAERAASDDVPLAALAFKIMADPYGRLTFLRVYSGVLKKGSYIYNATKDKKERISRLIVLKADERIEVDELRAGDLGAAIGLKDTFTGILFVIQTIPLSLNRCIFLNQSFRLL
jgi:elongation factor G